MTLIRLFIAAALALGVGCGQPLHDAAFVGHPAQVFVVVLDSPPDFGESVSSDLRLTLMWALDRGGAFIEQPGVATPATTDAEIRLVLHEAPPPEARAAGYALGVLVLFEDTDGDGQLDRDVELIRSQHNGTAIVWSPDGIDPANAPVTLPIPAGYQVIHGHLPCVEPFHVSSARRECMEPLPATCSAAGSCGRGRVCVRPFNVDGAEGYCGQLDVNPERCIPLDTRRVPYRPGANSGYIWLWVDACRQDSDCNDGYFCGLGSGSCLPGDGLTRVTYVEVDELRLALCVDHRAEARRLDRPFED